MNVKTKIPFVIDANKPINEPFDEKAQMHLIDYLIFIEKVQKGLADSENGLVKNKDESK